MPKPDPWSLYGAGSDLVISRCSLCQPCGTAEWQVVHESVSCLPVCRFTPSGVLKPVLAKRQKQG